MNTETPLDFARNMTPVSGLQSWSWALAILLALLACVVVLWLRKRGGAPVWLKPGNSPVRRLGGARLNQKVALEVVEFGHYRILLSVSETGAREIARERVTADDEERIS
ncbi:hypothetical protein ACNPPY_08370 [Achromobacter sp. AGC78]